jgi:hypothetical protein
MPLVHDQAIFTPLLMIASQTLVAQALSEVKMSSASMNSRQPRRCITFTSSAHRSGDFFR